MAVADLNGDGAPDVASANYSSGNVSVFLGRGDGTFPPSVAYLLGAPAPPFIRVGLPDDPVAGKRFTVTFRVWRGDRNLPQTSGKATSVVRVGGRAVRHAQSFRAGKATVTLRVPRTAKGKALRVTLTVRAPNGGAASKTVVYTVQ